VRQIVTCPECKLAQAVEGPDVEVSCQQCGSILQVPSVPSSDRHQATILWIDDDPMVLTFGKDILEQRGYRILTALDGPSGISAAAAARPDLIILDVVMPDMTGYEVCRRLRAEPDLQDAPILLLTSLVDPQVDVLGRDIGATFTMTKPADPSLIISAIEELLHQRDG
jgi:putative two-component system response regulator